MPYICPWASDRGHVANFAQYIAWVNARRMAVVSRLMYLGLLFNAVCIHRLHNASWFTKIARLAKRVCVFVIYESCCKYINLLHGRQSTPAFDSLPYKKLLEKLVRRIPAVFVKVIYVTAIGMSYTSSGFIAAPYVCASSISRRKRGGWELENERIEGVAVLQLMGKGKEWERKVTGGWRSDGLTNTRPCSIKLRGRGPAIYFVFVLRTVGWQWRNFLILYAYLRQLFFRHDMAEGWRQALRNVCYCDMAYLVWYWW